MQGYTVIHEDPDLQQNGAFSQPKMHIGPFINISDFSLHNRRQLADLHE